MDEKIICPECETENEKEYRFCKNCGTDLSVLDNAEQNENAEVEQKASFAQEQPAESRENTDAPRQTYVPPVSPDPQPSYNAYSQNYAKFVDSFDGVSMDEAAVFFGKKAPVFCEKISKMELSKSNVCWCWPVAVLSFFFGPIGAAIWFFYRKMYKIALILVAIGAALTLLLGVIGGVNDVLPVKDTVSLQSALQEGNLTKIIKSFSFEETFRTAVASALNSIVKIASFVLSGLFSMYFYKKFTAEKIKELRFKTDPRFYTLALAATGGTSAGMVFAGIGFLMAVSILKDIIILIIY